MRVELESTSQITTLVVGGVEVPARVWQGKTAGGVEVVALIVRVAAPKAADLSEFERDLQEKAEPSVDAIRAFPLRMVL